MPNTQEPTIAQKIEELTTRYSSGGYIDSNDIKNAVDEAILFGQAHMKQKVEQLVNTIETTQEKKYDNAIDEPKISKINLLSALNEI